MSVIIKTMTNLPEHCYDCPCHDGESGYCQADKGHRYSDYRPFWCPLVKMNNEHCALDQAPCDDCISRQANIDIIESWLLCDDYNEAERHIMRAMQSVLYDLPPVTPQQKIGHCKDCKYFEYDSWANVDGIPLIVAHEICSRWGNGCKTKEDGYCFMFEPKMQEVEDNG